MAFHNKTRFLTRMLIFITLGSVSIVFTDLLILNKKRSPDPNWWSHNVFTTLAYWSSNSNNFDVAALKSQHASYMEEGIEIPKSSVNSVEAPPFFPTRFATSEQISTIEPAAGSNTDDKADSIMALSLTTDDPSIGLSALGLKEDDISNIFSRRNVEDVILSHGEVPEYTSRSRPVTMVKPIPKAKEDQIKVADTQIASADQTYEVYTHAPVEVEDALRSADNQDTSPYKYTTPKGKGQIAIIIDDMGVTLRSKLVEVLPGPLTLSYLPYAESLKERAKRAHANGHEIMVHIPMEPLNGNLDGGPRVLKSSQSKAELLDALDWGLSQFDGYVGINNHMGSKITADKVAMDLIMAELKSRDLFFVDSRTIGSSVAAKSARDAKIPYAVRDIFLDHEATPEFIQSALTKLENKAAARGYAIAIGHPHKETIDALKEWIPTLEAKGLTLVPVSELLMRPTSEDMQAKWAQ
jgi:hypothetical protein